MKRIGGPENNGRRRDRDVIRRHLRRQGFSLNLSGKVIEEGRNVELLQRVKVDEIERAARVR